MNLLSILLKTLLADNALSALGKKTGLTSKQLKKLIPLALPLLLKFMTSNASTASGAQSLLGALMQHTSKKTMADQLDEADEEDGGKIVQHILGAQSGEAINGLAQQSGLSDDEVKKALGGMAPALLSSLSAATQSAAAKPKVDLSDGLDLSDVMGLLGGGQMQSSGLLGGLLGGSGGLLGGLLGGSNAAEEDNDLNGNALLSTLTALMR